MLYEMLSGQRAFQRDSSADTMAAILKEDPPELSGEGKKIPPGVDRVVRHALEKNPTERFQSARDFAFDLESLSGGTTSTNASGANAALAGAAVAGDGKLSPVKKAAMALGALALLAAGAIAGLLYTRATLHAVPPKYTRLTFKRGYIRSARFMPDGQSAFYSASWDGGPVELYEQRLDSPEARLAGLPVDTDVLAISSTGELAVMLRQRIAGPFQYSGTLAEVPASGSAPREIADDVTGADWSPDGKQIAVVRRAPAFETLEFPVGKVIYKSTGWMGEPHVSADGQHIAFVDHEDLSDDGGTIAVVDLAGNKKQITPRWSSARGLAWHGDEIYFTATASGSARALFAVNMSGRQRTVASAGGTMNVFDVAKDGRALFTQNDERIEMAVVGTHDNAPPRELGWLDWSLVTDVSRDGKFVVFGESGEGAGQFYGTYIRNTDGTPAVRLGDGGAGVLSPDGQWVAGPDSSGVATPGIYISPVHAGQVRHLSDAEITGLMVNWLPDSKTLLYTHIEKDGHFRVYSESIDGTNRKPVTPADDSYSPQRGGISPDGKWMLARRASDRNMVLFPLDGNGEPKVLSIVHAGEFSNHWTSDGKSFYIAARGDFRDGTPITKVDLATGKRELIKTVSAADRAGVAGFDGASVSADGSTIVFSYTRILSTLYVLEPAK
jgi:eukaryotic-like serine/threonine-protein kinase